jgi:hypothetical protein
MTTSKYIHFFTFMAFALGGLLLKYEVPTLVRDPPTTVGTVGTLVTIYGVVFAIIELIRMRTATKQAVEAARKVFDSFATLVTAREITECQVGIQIAVDALDECRAIPSSLIVQIVKLYSQVFHKELADETSLHRRNRSTIESYSFNENSVLLTVSNNHTKRALTSVAGQLAQLQGATKSFREQV